METSVACSPYLKAASRDSQAIRELLDRQEAEYVGWRSNRKPIRHPFASSKLNSPLRSLPQERSQANAKPLWLSLLEPTQHVETREDNARVASSSSHRGSTASHPHDPRPATRSGIHQSGSTPLLPSIQRTAGRLSTAASLASGTAQHDAATSPTPQRKKPSAAKRRLQKNLYDFHSSIVFSVAPPEEHTEPGQRTALPPVDGPRTARDHPCTSRVPTHEPDIAVIELPPPEQDELYVLPGLALVSSSFFDDVFEFDWAHSDVERIVRDAVERTRIKRILKQWYRVLVLYFRQHAGKTALTTTSTSSQYFASDLQQLPNRLSLLEDLNVQCVDPVKYGITETPLRRDGLITFITHAAKMFAVHSPNPVQFRIFTAEGIETSEAVRSLMVDHLAVYAQLQDAAHFRNVFLFDYNDNQGRRLRHLLSKHEGLLSSFFFEAITSVAAMMPPNRTRVTRSESYRADRLQTPTTTTMTFHTFVTILKALGAMPSGTQPRPKTPGTTGNEMSKASVVVTLDENRALRIFQQCLDLNSEFIPHNQLSSSNGGIVFARQQLTYPQFVEALLRVTLIRHETTICRGGFDICPGQHTCAVCQCQSNPPDYDLSAFDNAIEAVFAQIQSHKLRRSSKRTSLKMASIRSLQVNARQQSAGSVRVHRRALIVEPEVGASPNDDEDDEDKNDDED